MTRYYILLHYNIKTLYLVIIYCHWFLFSQVSQRTGPVSWEFSALTEQDLKCVHVDDSKLGEMSKSYLNVLAWEFLITDEDVKWCKSIMCMSDNTAKNCLVASNKRSFFSRSLSFTCVVLDGDWTLLCPILQTVPKRLWSTASKWRRNRVVVLWLRGPQDNNRSVWSLLD